MSKQRTDRLVDADLERTVLGAALLSDDALRTIDQIVTASDFAAPTHRHAWEAIMAAYSEGEVDTITVAAKAAGTDPNVTTQTLLAWQNQTPAISAAGHYAKQLVDLAARRRLLMSSVEISELAHDFTRDAGDALDAATALVSGIDLPTIQGEPDLDVDEYMESISGDYNWLIPGFLERGDRILVTGSEGAGKSLLCTQLAFQAGCGVHPWTMERIDPINVALIDLENPDRLVKRRLQKLRQHAPDDFDPKRLRIHSRAAGIDLLSRSSRQWLYDRVNANKTDLLVIGPVYRMFAGETKRGDTGGEDQARQVTAALDELRERAGITLIAETHAPHGDDRGAAGRALRPFGSSLWMRWPEFGVGIRRSDDDRNNTEYDLTHWRQARDQRYWPEKLRRSKTGWPWMPIGVPGEAWN